MPLRVATFFSCVSRVRRVRRTAKRIATRAVHGVRRKGNRPLVTPIYATSTWALDSVRQGAAFAAAKAPPRSVPRPGGARAARGVADRRGRGTTADRGREPLHVAHGDLHADAPAVPRADDVR